VLGPENGWTERRTLLAIIGGLVVAALFVIWEGRAVEPILPLELFKNRTFTLTSIIGFIIGAGMFGAIIMLPLYLQIIQGNSATSAGLKLIPLMLGILTFTVTSGRMITKTGKYKVYPVVGTVIMSLGIFLMSIAKVDTPYWQIAIFAVIIGGGLGLCMQTIVIALQNAVDFKDLGIATSSNTFFPYFGRRIWYRDFRYRAQRSGSGKSQKQLCRFRCSKPRSTSSCGSIACRFPQH